VRGAAPTLDAAAAAPTAPEQIDALLAFIASHERCRPADAWYERHMRARGGRAVGAARCCATRTRARPRRCRSRAVGRGAAVDRGADLLAAHRRAGVTLLDASAAPYADVDEARLVGLVESDWPERGRAASSIRSRCSRSSAGRRAGSARRRATRFQDLLRLPRRRVSLSTFTLEDDAIVSPSPLLEDVDAVGLPIERLVARSGRGARVRARALAIDPARRRRGRGGGVAGAAAVAHVRRAAIPRLDRPRAPRRTPSAGSSGISSVRSSTSPRTSSAAGGARREAWMTPQERGHFVHEVFESFFAEWQRAASGAITTATSRGARAVRRRRRAAARAAARRRSRARADAAPRIGAARGFGERAFAFEIEDDVAVVERLLEYELEGPFTFAGRRRRARSRCARSPIASTARRRHAAHRRLQDRPRAGAEALAAAADLRRLRGAGAEGRHGRSWTVGRAGYIAFKEKSAFSELQNRPKAIADGQAGCSTSSTPSSAASSRCGPTSRSSATGARIPACAARTTSATSRE
jgi:hypothetical protein